MEESGLDQGILFLDEINCVSETLYPSMLQFLQFKTFGRHSVPDGWIVVCAGNPAEYNRNVHEFDIVTLDRLRLVEIEPNYKAWRDYAREQRVHPAVITYLDVRPEDFYLVESTPQSKHFVSARSWSELSGLMLLLEGLGKDVDEQVFKQYLQHPEISAKFASYYQLFMKYRSDYQVDLILQGEAPDEIAGRARDAAFDERLALMALLLDNLEDGMGGLLEQVDALVQVRDVMAAAKAKAADASGVAGGFSFEPFMMKAAEQREALVQRATQRTDNLSNARTRSWCVSLLRELALCGTYEAAADAYQARLDALDEQGTEQDKRLSNAYEFIDTVFGEGPEALVFTTELASRRQTTRFLARFDSESYRIHSQALALDSALDKIYEEIQAYKLAQRDQQAAAQSQPAAAAAAAQQPSPQPAAAEPPASEQPQAAEPQQPSQPAGTPHREVPRYRSNPRRRGNR